MSLPDVLHKRNRDVDKILEKKNKLLKKEMNKIKQD